MFANSLRLLGREYRITPSHVETVAGRPSRPPKSPIRATRTQRCTSTWRVRGDGYAIRRDDFRQGIIPMYTPENEAARPEFERAADEAAEATNLNGEHTKSASILFAEADRIIATFPGILTWKTKHKAQSDVLRLFLAALVAGQLERAV